MTELITLGQQERLREVAAQHGLLRLGLVSLRDPRLQASRERLDEFVDAGLAGEMTFLERTKELRQWPEHLLNGARSALVGIVPYDAPPGAVARYAQCLDYHTLVHRRVERVARALKDLHPSAQTLVCVDTKPVPERSLAALAGIGFLGKNGCLIAPSLGSFVLIGSLLTDLDFERDATSAAPSLRDAVPLADACGSCTACLDACPTQAFDAPGRLDPRRCIAYLTIERQSPMPRDLAAQVGVRIAGCDVCQDVCPYNKSVHRHQEPARSARLPLLPDARRAPELRDLLSIGANQHRQLVKDSALDRIPRRRMRRNAAIALYHRRDQLSDEDRAALTQSLRDEDAELAYWAARALGLAPPDAT